MSTLIVLSIFKILLIGFSFGGEINVMRGHVNIRWHNLGSTTQFHMTADLSHYIGNETRNLWLSVGINEKEDMVNK